VVGACSDDTNRGLVSSHVTSASAISEGRRRVGICGSLTSTLSGSGSVAEDAQAHNNALLRVIHLKGAHNATGEMAAAYCAAHIYGDGVRKGIAQYTAANQNALQLAPAIYAPEVTDYTTNTQRAALLAAGVSVCVASFANPGYAQVVRPVTTRTQALSGATSYLVIDPSKVTVSFEVADRWETFCAEAYAGKNLAPNPTDPDNTPSNEDVIWPDAMREDVLALLRTMEDEGKLVNVNAHADEVVVEASESDATVALVTIPVAVIPHLHSVVNTVNQVG
jgi:phage tail sheath gpL-like